MVVMGVLSRSGIGDSLPNDSKPGQDVACRRQGERRARPRARCRRCAGTAIADARRRFCAVPAEALALVLNAFT